MGPAPFSWATFPITASRRFVAAAHVRGARQRGCSHIPEQPFEEDDSRFVSRGIGVVRLHELLRYAQLKPPSQVDTSVHGVASPLKV
jgi:hypothetical protein